MKRSFFDIIILIFTLFSIVVFLSIVFYSTNSTRKALIEEKTEVLTNEAFLIAEQSISHYIHGTYSKDYTEKSISYYASTLKASIWYADDLGRIVIAASAEGHPEAPSNINFLKQDFDLINAQNFVGNFYDYFEDDVITVAIPIKTYGNPNGMIFIHSTVSELSDLQKDLLQTTYVPFLLMLIFSIAMLALISGKIIKPIKKLNAVAAEYATGNFDVKTDIKANNEIGQLALTMEYMASELSKLDDYRRDFISNISHDFRSPLTSIKGYIVAILDGTIPYEKQDRYLNIVVDETNRLSKLTSSMLQLNDLNSYGIWLVFKEFDIVDLVKNAIDTFEGKCVKKHISIILNNHCNESIVYADKTKIQQVIYNLIDNAIKFTPGGNRIFITLTEKNEKIFVSVKDEGCGIPADKVNQVWVRFYKADSSRGRDKQGTGLGLAITKEIIKAHNENINVVSTEGVGSEFTFSLTKANSKEQYTNREDS